MYVNKDALLKAFNKISDFVASDSKVPGVMLRIHKPDDAEEVTKEFFGIDEVADQADEDETGETEATLGVQGKLDLCYTDSHKSLIETIDAVVEDSDVLGGVVVEYDVLKRTLEYCKSTSKIKVMQVRFNFINNSIIRADISYGAEVFNDSGESIGCSKKSNTSVDIGWKQLMTDNRSKLLAGFDYDGIFKPDENVEPDTIGRKELIDALMRTSLGDGKMIYVSADEHAALTSNRAHMTYYKISSNELSEEEAGALKFEIAGKFPSDQLEAEYDKAYKNMTSRIHYSLCIPQNIAKALVGVLNRSDVESVSVYRNQKFCNMFIDDEGEHVGIWFEMSNPVKAHLQTLQTYRAIEYNSYQITFLREFLMKVVDSAKSVTKSDKSDLAFSVTDKKTPDGRPIYELSVKGESASASISNEYKVECEDAIDTVGDLLKKKITLSLVTLQAMLSQLKTDMIAFDVHTDANNLNILRVAEIDGDKLEHEYTSAKERLALEAGQYIPVEEKVKYRANTLGVIQYTTLAR